MTLIAEPPKRSRPAAGTATGSLRADVRGVAELAGLLVAGRYSADRRASKVARDRRYLQFWIDAARALDLPTRRVGEGLEIALDGGTIEVHRSANTLDSQEVLDRAGDKALVHRLLAGSGVAVTEHRSFTLATLSDAAEFLAAGGRCVVKPARDTSAGHGVTTNVTDARSLRAAAASAAAAGARAARSSRTGSLASRLPAKFAELRSVPLLIERQVTGEDYRLLYLDGVLVDAVHRGSPTIVGDGERTVAAIVADLNAQRLDRAGDHAESILELDTDLVRTLALQSLTPSSVPERGRVVRLKTTANDNALDDNHAARHLLHPDVVEQGARAAVAVGARLVGVDVITSDPGLPLAVTGGCVLEVNTTPGFAFHYHGGPGAVDVARVVLERLA
jgi:cyanophycin synthetase